MLIPVILSGGAGTRPWLWPASRAGHPRPLMSLPDGQSLLGKTCQRAAARLGYIETGAPLDAKGAAKVQRFMEKTDLQTATHFPVSSEYRVEDNIVRFEDQYGRAV